MSLARDSSSESDDYTYELADIGRLPTEPPPRRRIPQLDNLPPMPPQRLAKGIRLDPDRLADTRSAISPLLWAARPLMEVKRRLPFTLDAQAAKALHAHLMHEVAHFHCLAEAAGVRFTQIVVASYVLCTMLDEAANDAVRAAAQEGNTEDAALLTWATPMLATHFHQDGHGGARFFLLVGACAAEPKENADLLEILIFALDFGFEGMYRTMAGGRRALADLRDRLREILSKTRYG